MPKKKKIKSKYVYPLEQVEERIEDIKNHPEKHKHTFDDLLSCCVVDGAIDSRIMEAHSQFVDLGTNGGIKCDTVEGPCACGAWH